MRDGIPNQICTENGLTTHLFTSPAANSLSRNILETPPLASIFCRAKSESPTA